MWIKICGVRDASTAALVAEMRPDALGLNFYRGSARYISPDAATEITAALPPEIEAVGVFVNQTADEIVEVSHRCRLGGVQLHGDEPASVLAELRGRLPECRLIRAVRLSDCDAAPLQEVLQEFDRTGIQPDALLIDARREGQYGGTGERVDWPWLADLYDPAAWPPLILAGGLDAGNVAGAIDIVRPWGVDVASGVESAPGRKDADAVARFIHNARQALP